MKHKKFVFKIIIAVFVFFVFVAPFHMAMATAADEQAAAKEGLGGASKMFTIFVKPTGFKGTDQPEAVVGKVIQGLLVIIGVIFGILMVYGGYLWMIGMGNEERVKKAKGILEAAIIGLIIVIGAYALSAFIVSKVIGAASFGV